MQRTDSGQSGHISSYLLGIIYVIDNKGKSKSEVEDMGFCPLSNTSLQSRWNLVRFVRSTPTLEARNA